MKVLDFEKAKEKIGRWIEVDDNKLYAYFGLGYLSHKRSMRDSILNRFIPESLLDGYAEIWFDLRRPIGGQKGRSFNE